MYAYDVSGEGEPLLRELKMNKAPKSGQRKCSKIFSEIFGIGRTLRMMKKKKTKKKKKLREKTTP